MTESAGKGLVALVAYIPEPLASGLHRLRHLLPGVYNADPHITLLPPRPLCVDIGVACSTIESVLAGETPFEVELLEVEHFAATHTLYFSLASGSAQLRTVHARLNRGDLHHQEAFEYSPHLTIGGPVEPCSLEGLRTALNEAWREADSLPRFLLDELVCLHQPEGREWTRVWSKRLSSPALANQTC
jgi:2'-5' RNA ligase